MRKKRNWLHHRRFFGLQNVIRQNPRKWHLNWELKKQTPLILSAKHTSVLWSQIKTNYQITHQFYLWRSKV